MSPENQHEKAPITVDTRFSSREDDARAASESIMTVERAKKLQDAAGTIGRYTVEVIAEAGDTINVLGDKMVGKSDEVEYVAEEPDVAYDGQPVKSETISMILPDGQVAVRIEDAQVGQEYRHPNLSPLYQAAENKSSNE